ncbi:MAG: polymerase sigma factor [Frankiales bacterium]|nr:polymerase sigma factor [Frankiales bacterium]
MRAHEEDQFGEFVDARLPALRRTAFFLCGDWHSAEDLAQTTLIRMYRAWPGISAREAVDGYARQVLVRVFLDDRRRPWRRERATERVPEGAAQAGTEYEVRDELLGALAMLPAQQRAAVVLRYWEDLSVEETARTLGVGEGTVKSYCARGLSRLRELLPEPAGQAIHRTRPTTLRESDHDRT